jgi:transposase
MRQNLIHQNVFNFLLKQIDEVMPAMRKRRAQNEHVLYNILRVLKHGIPWRATGSSNGEYAWQTIHRRFTHLVNNEHFFKVWKTVVERYATRRNNLDKRHFQNIYIDTTFIKNVGGVDMLGKNSTDRGRKATKISIVCDEDRIILGHIATPCKSDVKVVETTLDSVPFDLQKMRKRKATYLIADKAYASYKLSNCLEKRKLRLVTDRKKRQRHTNHVCGRQMAKDKLKRRYIVEHAFGIMKRFKRIPRREDRKITVYNAFFQLGMIIRMLERYPEHILDFKR